MEKTAVAILDKLAELDAIDAELWENGIIWSDHFVANLAPVFARRNSALPQRPKFRERKSEAGEVSGSFRDENSVSAEFSAAETDKEKESKVEYSKAEKREGHEPRAGARGRVRYCSAAHPPDRECKLRIVACHSFWPDRAPYRFFAAGPPVGLWNHRTRWRCRC